MTTRGGPRPSAAIVAALVAALLPAAPATLPAPPAAHAAALERTQPAGDAPAPKKRTRRPKRAAQKPARPSPQRPSRPLAPSLELPRWLNSPPLRSADLWGAGRPSVVAFWTGGSAPCERSIPAMREIHFLFAKRGLALVGIHVPSSARDRDPKAVAETAKKWGFTYPLGLDRDSTAWKSFKNRTAPALHLIDRRGVIRATHVGELRVKTRAWTNFAASIEEVVAETD
ncbi:MAG TPA: redoxin domain-containing protein [Acidobacteriota bacterium]|nr:redoxin domain-containing protein [Acidobacteriota bacterium]